MKTRLDSLLKWSIIIVLHNVHHPSNVYDVDSKVYNLSNLRISEAPLSALPLNDSLVHLPGPSTGPVDWHKGSRSRMKQRIHTHIAWYTHKEQVRPTSFCYLPCFVGSNMLRMALLKDHQTAVGFAPASTSREQIHMIQSKALVWRIRYRVPRLSCKKESSDVCNKKWMKSKTNKTSVLVGRISWLIWSWVISSKDGWNSDLVVTRS